MGYDVTFYIGEPLGNRADPGVTPSMYPDIVIHAPRWGSWGFASVLRELRSRGPVCQVLTGRGTNGFETVDAYGDPLRPLDPAKLLAWIDAEYPKHRKLPAVAALRAALKRASSKRWQDRVFVIAYGH